MSEINYDERFRQRISFTGMNYHRGISPTDIDFMLDFNGHIIMAEIKSGDAPFTAGQKIALTNLAIRFVDTDKKFLAMFCTHNTPSNEDVVAADTDVEEYICVTGGKLYNWQRPVNAKTLSEAIDFWITTQEIR